LYGDIFALRLFSEEETHALAEMYFSNVDPGRINSALEKIAMRCRELDDREQEQFRSLILDYIKKYAFVSQIITYADTNLEKLYVVLKMLVKKLPKIEQELPKEVLDEIDLESIKIPRTSQGSIALEAGGEKLEPIGEGKRGLTEEDTDFLSRILKEINDRYGTDFTEDDRVILNDLSMRLLKNQKLQGTIRNNTRDAALIKYGKMFEDERVSMLNNHYDLYEKLDKNREMKDYVKEKIFEFILRKMDE
jgi:type I restriction enzyme R subunit